jgi:hypothetical protein
MATKKPAVLSKKTAKKHQPSAAALAGLAEHQFKPGQSGNPGGRPKKFITLLSDALREELGEAVGDHTRAELAAKKIVDCRPNEQGAARLTEALRAVN